MLAALFRDRHLYPIHIHSVVTLFALGVVAITPNKSVLPLAWTGSLYNETRFLVVLLLCCYALLLILFPAARATWLTTFTCLPNHARLGFIAILFIGVLSSLLAARPEAGLLEVSNFALLYVLTIGIATWTRETKLAAMRVFIYGLMGMALAYEVRSLTGWIVMFVEQVRFSNSEFFPGFDNLRFFNQVQTWTLPLLGVGFWLVGRSSVLRSVAFTVLALWWLLLLIAASRGTFLAVCGGALLVLAAFGRRSLPWLKLQIFAAVAGGMAYFFFLSHTAAGSAALPQRLAKAFEDPTRLELINKAWLLFLRDPIFGTGPMHYAYYYHDSFISPHNSLMQLLSEWGLPATLLLLVLGVRAIFAWIRHARDISLENNMPTLFRVALLASISGAALESLVSGIIISPLSQLLAACVIGLMLGDYLSHRSHTIPAKPNDERANTLLLGGLITALFGLGGLSALTLFEAKDLQARAAEYYDQMPSEYRPPNPRFWLPGQLQSPD